MGEIETSGPEAEQFLQRAALERRHEDRRARRAVLGALPRGRRRARRPLHLPARAGPLPDRHQRGQPREGPRLVPRARGRLRRRGHRRARRCAMLAVQGPEARAALERVTEGDAAGAHARPRDVSIAGVDVPRLRHRLHRRGRRRAADPAGRRRGGLGRAARRRASCPPGLGARDTLRLEVCFHLYGNDLSEDRNPIEAGLGWCCKLDTGFIGADALRGVEPDADARAVRLHRRRHPAPGQPGAHRARRGRRDQRHAVALPRDGHRHGVRSGRRRGAGHADRGRRARQAARRRGAREAALPEGDQ